jgi:hypothetical protein
MRHWVVICPLNIGLFTNQFVVSPGIVPDRGKWSLCEPGVKAVNQYINKIRIGGWRIVGFS